MSELFDIKSHVKEIDIEGRKLLLEYDYRAYAMVEEACQKSIYELKDDFLSGKITLTNQAIILYCGLLRHQRDYGMDKIKSLKNIGNIIANALPSMIEAFFLPLLPPCDI